MEKYTARRLSLIKEARIEESRAAQVKYLQQQLEPWPPIEQDVPKHVTFMRAQHFYYKTKKRRRPLLFGSCFLTRESA